MNSLQNIAIIEIRKKWNIYEDKTDIIKELAWNDWYNKFSIDKDDFYVKLFIKFIMNDDTIVNDCNNCIVIKNNEIIFKGLNGSDRKEIHSLCDKIGLHHKSIKLKSKKHLYIFKPKIWLWEFSEKNPYSEAPEVYQKREDKKMARLTNMECYNCGCNGLDALLFTSVYINDIFCEDCLETVSDGDGGILDDHKFEPCN